MERKVYVVQDNYMSILGVYSSLEQISQVFSCILHEGSSTSYWFPFRDRYVFTVLECILN